MIKNFNWRMVLRMLGILLLVEAFFMLTATIVSYIYKEDDFRALLESSLITAIMGGAWMLLGDKSDKQIDSRAGYILVSFVWVVFSFFGMLPFLLSKYIPSITDAFFETMSGFTTTGASILNDIESLPHGLLYWRSLTQWLGGMGIMVLSLAILPLFGAGMQIYSAEAPGPTHDKLRPRIADTARRLWVIYLIFTIIIGVLLYLFGMSPFDAICHAFTTLSSGGYSTKQASIGYWSSPFIHYTIIIGMIIAGINFSLIYFSFSQKSIKKFFKDEELRVYLITIAIFACITGIGLCIFNNCDTLSAIENRFRSALFHVVSIMTTTGFATEDYLQWPTVLWFLIVLLLCTGASAGSTSGGIKLIRLHIIGKNILYEFKRIMHPKAIMPVRINRRIVNDNIVANIYAFISIYIIIAIISTIIFLLFGLPLKEAVGVSLTALDNAGPGLGAQGPAGNFYMLPAIAKWYMSFLMLLGRLELFTILLLMSPSFWKR